MRFARSLNRHVIHSVHGPAPRLTPTGPEIAPEPRKKQYVTTRPERQRSKDSKVGCRRCHPRPKSTRGPIVTWRSHDAVVTGPDAAGRGSAGEQMAISGQSEDLWHRCQTPPSPARQARAHRPCSAKRCHCGAKKRSHRAHMSVFWHCKRHVTGFASAFMQAISVQNGQAGESS